jgi:hypothetical protein
MIQNRAASTSEPTVSMYETTDRNSPEDKGFIQNTVITRNLTRERCLVLEDLEVARHWRRLHNEQFSSFYSDPDNVTEEDDNSRACSTQGAEKCVKILVL